MIRDDVIEKILDQTDIVEVIGSRIPLKKAGRNFKANCPFHGEKTPSFIVSQEKQIFHCFGCGEGGNAISFLMKYEKLPFREAMKLLADKTNVRLPDAQFGDPRQGEYFDKLYEINNAARDMFAANLAGPNGGMCRRYLTERGVTEESIKTFELGYALNSWDALIEHSSSCGHDIATLEKAGLVLKRDKMEGHYDRFRNRAIFPIHDVRQRIIGFGGRTLDDTQQPKYMNSPESPIYSKGKNLYGLNFSKGFIKEKDFCIIVEGYLDFIIPFQYGVKNIVATCGTALTSEQIKLLKRFTNTVVIVYDSDEAGEEASLRGLDILISHDVNVRIAALPKGHDPDTFVREHGPEAFERLVKSSKDLFDYKIGLLMSRYNKDGVRGKAAIATLMLPTIARIQNDILKAAFLKKMSEVLGVDESSLRTEIKKVRIDYSYEVPVQNEPAQKIKARDSEMMLLGIVLDDPEILPFIDEKLGMSNLKNESIKKIVSALTEAAKETARVSPARIMSRLDDEGLNHMISEAIGLLDAVVDREKALFDCIKTIKRENFKDDSERFMRDIKAAQESHDTARVDDLMAKYNELLKSHKG